MLANSPRFDGLTCSVRVAHLAIRAGDHLTKRVERANDRSELVDALRPEKIDLIQGHVVRDLYLLDQQIHDGAQGGAVAAEVGPRAHGVAARKLGDERRRIDDRDLQTQSCVKP